MLLSRKNNYNLWDEIFGDPFFRNPFSSEKPSFMRTDIEEKDNQYLLNVELPGYQKEDIHAELNNGYLTISAERTENRDEKDKEGNYIRKERYSGSCKRNFYVGDQVKEEDINASFKDGVLILTVPKEQQATIEENKKMIPIE